MFVPCTPPRGLASPEEWQLYHLKHSTLRLAWLRRRAARIDAEKAAVYKAKVGVNVMMSEKMKQKFDRVNPFLEKPK